MNYLFVFVLVILLFIKDYPDIEEKTAPAKGTGPFAVASPSTWLDSTKQKSNCEHSSKIESTPLEGPRFPAQACESHGYDFKGALEMCLVQKIEQAFDSTVWLLLHSLEQVHRHPLRSWTKELYTGIDQIDIEKKVVKGRLGRLWLFTAKTDRTGSSIPRILTTEENKDTKAEEKQTADQLWGSCIGSTVAINGNSHAASHGDSNLEHRRSGSIDFDRAGASTGILRQTAVRGSPDSDRQGEEAKRTSAHDGQDSTASLRQAGEEKKVTSASTECEGAAAQVMDPVCGGVHQEMAEFCDRLCQEGCGARAEGHGCARSSLGCEEKIRHRQRRQRSPRSTRRSSRRDLRHGGGWRRKDGNIRRDTSEHQHDGGELGNSQNEAESGPVRACQQAAENTRRCRRSSIWTWSCCAYAFSSARQIDRRMEVCLGLTSEHFQQDEYAVRQWTHSILEEPDFVSEWKASIQALDLAFDIMDEPTNLPGGTKLRTSSDRQARQGMHVKFNAIAELFVGEEHAHFLQSWRYSCGTPVQHSTLFCPLDGPLADETSFMSMGNFGSTDNSESEHWRRRDLTDHEEVARDPADIDLEMVEVEVDAAEESSDYEGTVSEEADREHGGDWFATLLFALDFQPTPLRVNWNDQESMHREAAQALQVSPHELYYLHHVRSTPQDLEEAGVVALLGQRHGDLAQGSTLRLILLDVEFHAAVPTIQPEVVRRVVRLPRQIGRLALLHRLGLAAYCRTTRQSCILWCNGDMVSHHSVRPIDLEHGTYMRIAVPPSDSEVRHIGTRCIATACNQGVTMAELCDRHALFAMGWYDTIIDLPLVPLRPDEDDFMLLQKTITVPPLPQRPWFLSKSSACIINSLPPTDHAEEDVGAITRDYVSALDQPVPGGIFPQPGLDEQPEHIHHLVEQLEEHGAVEMEEEGPILYVTTWFLNHPLQSSCRASRTVRLTQNFALWHQQFLRAWSDLLEEGVMVNFYIVFPQPPATRMQPEHMPHIILLQRSPEGGRAAIITVLDTRNPEQGLRHSAHFLHMVTSKAELIDVADKQADCYPAISELQCMMWHGEQEMREEHRLATHHGISFFLIIQDVTFMTTTAWDSAEDDALNLMQQERHGSTRRTSARTFAGFDPQAPVFQPGRPIIQLQNEFVQDLFKAWTDKIDHCRETEQSAQFEVWFVDHDRQRFICAAPRKVWLHEDYTKWEQQIKNSWKELVVPHEEHELFLIQPAPPDMAIDIAGHILIVQNPHDVLVTNLVTVYLHDGPSSWRGLHRQIAGTTHEHIYMDHIVTGLGYAEQCLHPTSTHQCEVWYEQNQLRPGQPWMGRSGMGFLVHLRPRTPQGPILLQLDKIITKTRERQTHGQVAHTHGPRDRLTPPNVSQQEDFNFPNATAIIAGDISAPLPNYVEIFGDVTSESVQEELERWGHQVIALDCHPHNKFFCIKPGKECDTFEHHDLFCHSDLADEDGCFAHSADSQLTEAQMMKFLCQLGYSRAVIMQQEQLQPTWTKVLFLHQDPVPETQQKPMRQRTPWPARPTDRETVNKPLIDFAHNANTPSACQLRTSFNQSDLELLFQSTNDVLCRDFCLECLPAFVKEALQPATEDEIDLDSFDRLLIYTDGSSRPEGRRLPVEHADELGWADTWAFLVLGERFQPHDQPSEIQAIGWLAHPVRYDMTGQAFNGASRIGADQAERAAVTFAGLWRLAQNTTVRTVICTDSATTGGQAFGTLGTADPDESYRLLRGVFQALQCALPADHLTLHHTKSHAGDPFNEFVDIVAKEEARKSFNLKRQNLDLRTWRDHLSHLWMIFAEKFGVPQWQDGLFDVPAPQLPALERKTALATKVDARSHREVRVQCGLCLASANVQSLSKGPAGHGGKLHYLQQQMKDFNINCMGIQEARTDAGMRTANNILVFASGGQGGQLGVEIWINLDQPVGWQNKKGHCQLHYLHRSDFCVVHSDPRRLLIRCDNETSSFWLFNTHAPHSGKSLQERQEWWESSTQILQQYCDLDPLYWLMDANAPPGPADGTTVFEQGYTTTTTTKFLREALQAQQLCLPATSKCHVGPRTTWTAIDGQTEHCIDHIAVPVACQSRCTWSQVLHDFDLAQTHEDHAVVVLQLQWETVIHVTSSSVKVPALRRGDFCNFDDQTFRDQLRQYQTANWHTDVEKHAEGLVQHIQNAMKQHLPLKQNGAKKVYITDEIWQLRLQKLLCRQKCKLVRRQLGRESLRSCFQAWKHPHARVDAYADQNYNYGTTLRCHQVKWFCGFATLRKQMRKALQSSKNDFIQKSLNNVDDKTAASDLLRMLKPFIGPTNLKQQKKKPLPLIRDADQQPCVLPNEALAVWISFFQNMEGGRRVTADQMRQEWIADLSDLRQQEFALAMKEFPTLVDMEIALRRVPSRKAKGPDDIPGEICHFHADVLAVQMYTQIMKIALHGQEPLLYKGGRLIPAYKGKGDPSQVASFRSLLVSSHLGKSIHRSIRQHQAQAYEHFLQAQQLGGRRKVPVQLALHQARAFLRRAKEKHFSTGLLFLDLTEAFYRILRELTMGGQPTDELLAFVLQRLQLPADSLHQLHALLDERTALQQAGLSFTARNCIRAIHQNTHFWLQGQTDLVATYLGTRPGDSFADLIFGFTWSVVLKKLQDYMETQGMAVSLRTSREPPFFTAAPDHSADENMKTYLGPTWMDDLCLCLQGESPQQLESHMGPAIGYLLDLCYSHLMTPNLSKGKTELLLSFRGAGSRKHTIQHYGPNASGHFEVICEHQMQRVTVVKAYRHLGGQLHHTSDQNGEVRIKIATAHQAFNQHRKLLYHNDQIQLAKKVEIFNTLVITKMLYGADSWIAHDTRTMRKFETAVIKLYKRLLRWKHDGHHTSEQVIAAVQQPAPVTLLRRARLRYLTTLFQCGVPDIWHLLGEDTQWVRLIEEDMIWMWQQLRHASNLQDPREHAPQWFDLLEHHPRYWKRLIGRACYHDTLQRRKVYQVVTLHDRVFQRFREARVEHGLAELPDEVPTQWQTAESPSLVYGCMGCRLKCKSKAGEGAHMYKKHQQASVLRSYIDQTQCRVCLREMHTFTKMKAHLYYSAACRAVLLAGDQCDELAPGAGSRAERLLETQHDRCLPPLQAEGPSNQPQRLRDFHDIDETLHIYMVDFLVDHGALDQNQVDFGRTTRTWISQHAISWTRTRNTLIFSRTISPQKMRKCSTLTSRRSSEHWINSLITARGISYVKKKMHVRTAMTSSDATRNASCGRKGGLRFQRRTFLENLVAKESSCMPLQEDAEWATFSIIWKRIFREMHRTAWWLYPWISSLTDIGETQPEMRPAGCGLLRSVMDT